MKLLHPAVGLCAVVILLAGCSRGSAGSSETVLSMPPSPAPEQAVPTVTPAGPTAPDDDVRGDGDGRGGPDEALQDDREPGDSVPAGVSEHCVMVAGGVTTAMLAPLTLWPSSDPQDLQVLERQILDLRDRVPAELHDDFTALAHSVEVPPEGSGQFDENALRDAMAPVQQWLDIHCADK